MLKNQLVVQAETFYYKKSTRKTRLHQKLNTSFSFITLVIRPM